MALGACDSTPAQPAQPPVTSPLLGLYTPVLPASPHPSGSIVLADRQFPDAVNPLFSGSAVDFELQSALWAAPVVFDNHFHAQPDQLTEVPLPENGDVRDNGYAGPLTVPALPPVRFPGSTHTLAHRDPLSVV